MDPDPTAIVLLLQPLAVLYLGTGSWLIALAGTVVVVIAGLALWLVTVGRNGR